MSKGKLSVVGLLLFVLAAAVFLPTLRHDFVNFDDDIYVYANAQVQQGLSWTTLRWACTTLHGDFWHPLTWISHAFDCQIYGLRPWGHHLTSVLLHAVNTLLLFLALCRMTGGLWRSALVAGLFAVHPLHVESVAWISDRKDLLGAFFWMLTLLAYARYAVRRPPSTGQRTRYKVWYVMALLAFSCALLSKSTAMTLPMVLLLLDWWPLHRFQLTREVSEPRTQDYSGLRTQDSGLRTQDLGLRTTLPLLVEKLPFLALSMAAGVVAVWGGRAAGVVGAVDTFPLSHRIHNAIVSYLVYGVQALWPAKLAAFYPYPTAFPAWTAVGAALAGVLVTWLVLWASRRRPYLAVGWFWYLVTLFPMAGLIQVGGQARADRYTYIPLVGLFIMLAWGLGELCRQGRSPADTSFAGTAAKRRGAARTGLKPGAARTVGSWLAPMLGGLTLAACVALTLRQLPYWRDTEALFRHAINVTQGNHVAYDNLGLYFWNQGRTDDAIESYRKSLAIVPKFQPLNNLGLALASRGKYAEAAAQYDAALQFRPDEVAPRKGLAEALARSGKLDAAIIQYQMVLRSVTNDLPTRNNLGIALMMEGKVDEAIVQFREALRLDPNQPATHGNLAYAFATQPKLPEAIEQYREVLRLTPDDPRARQGLGSALAEQGKLDEAVQQFIEAVRLNPDDPALHYRFGQVLERQGRHEQAIAQFKVAVQLKPDYPEARRELDSLSGAPKP
jgi:protein O-mannosyl-transferase